MTPRDNRFPIFLAPIAAIALGSGSIASETAWTNASGGQFTDAGNWSDGVPGPTDTALFGIPSFNFYNVLLGTSITIDRLVSTTSAPTLNLGGQTLTILGSTPDLPALVVGDGAGNDVLFVRSGALDVTTALVGPGPDGTGQMTLGQLGGVAFSIDRLVVGGGGNGVVSLSNFQSSFAASEVIAGEAPGATGTLILSNFGGPNICDGNATFGVAGTGRLWLNVTPFVVTGDLFTALEPGSEGELRLQQFGGDLVVEGDTYFGPPAESGAQDGERAIGGQTTLSSIGGPTCLLEGDLIVSSISKVIFRLGVTTETGTPGLIVAGSIIDPDSMLSLVVDTTGSDPGFLPPIGAVYTLATSGPPTIWPMLEVPATTLLRRYEPICTLQSVSVEVFAGLADLNGDQAIDQADLRVLLAAWGPVNRGDPSPADFNGDGIVDGADLGLFLTALGAG